MLLLRVAFRVEWTSGKCSSAASASRVSRFTADPAEWIVTQSTRLAVDDSDSAEAARYEEPE